MGGANFLDSALFQYISHLIVQQVGSVGITLKSVDAFTVQLNVSNVVNRDKLDWSVVNLNGGKLSGVVRASVDKESEPVVFTVTGPLMEAEEICARTQTYQHNPGMKHNSRGRRPD